MRVPSFLRARGRLLARTLLGVATIAFAVFIATSDSNPARAIGSYSFGVENSWIRVQNIGDADANVELDYFDEYGQLAGKDNCPSSSCPPMYPGSGWTFFQGQNATLRAGFQGSAVISTDQPVVAVMAKEMQRDGGRLSIAGDTLVTGAGSHQIYLPVVGKHDGPNADWSGRFVIQNMSDSAVACVTITYLSNYTDSEIAWEPFKLPDSGKPSVALPGCPYGGVPLQPRGSIFKYPDNMSIPDHFTGSVRIDLSTNAAGQAPEKQFISATADSWNSNVASFGSYRGVDANDLGKEIILPLMDREVGPDNSFSTRFFIANKDPDKPAKVTLEFTGYDLNVSDTDPITFTNTFTINGGRMCFQNLDNEANCLADGDTLPTNFVGTAHLTSTQPIAVIVDRDTWSSQYFTDYRGIRPQDAGTRVLLPVLNKNYGPENGVGYGWNSWFRVMVADGGSATVTVTYYGLDLPGGSYSYTVPVDREFTVFQNAESFLPDGFAGTAIISADRPIVALGSIHTDSYSGDTDVLYNGVALD